MKPSPAAKKLRLESNRRWRKIPLLTSDGLRPHPPFFKAALQTHWQMRRIINLD